MEIINLSFTFIINVDLELRDGDLQIKFYPAGTTLYKGTAVNGFDLDTRSRDLTEGKRNPGIIRRTKRDYHAHYFAFDEEEARGYGRNHLNHEADANRPGAYQLNVLESPDGFYALKIMKRAYGIDDIDQDIKATAIKKYIEENGLGDLDKQNLWQTKQDRDTRNWLFRTKKDLLPALDECNLGLDSPLFGKKGSERELIVQRNVFSKFSIRQKKMWSGMKETQIRKPILKVWTRLAQICEVIF